MCWEICEISYWEDDPVQAANPWATDGPNGPNNLVQAQAIFQKIRVLKQRFLDCVRPPTSDYK